MDLITLYGKMGLSYIEMSEDEMEEGLESVGNTVMDHVALYIRY